MQGGGEHGGVAAAVVRLRGLCRAARLQLERLRRAAEVVAAGTAAARQVVAGRPQLVGGGGGDDVRDGLEHGRVQVGLQALRGQVQGVQLGLADQVDVGHGGGLVLLGALQG